MNEKIYIFDIKSMNDELIEEFYNFFYKYNLMALFTNEHRASSITVSDLEVRSVVNPNNKYHKDLKEFGDLLSLANDNKSFEEAIFKIIYEARSFGGMMKTIRKLMNNIKTLNPDHLFNLWNIVWYNKEMY